MTPDEEAQFRQRLAFAAQDDNALATMGTTPGLAPPPTPGLSGVPDFAAKLGERAGASARRMSASASNLPGPAGVPGMAISAALGPQPREMQSFVRDEPEEIKPMVVPSAEVAPVATLDPKYQQLRQVGATPGGGGIGGAPSGLASARDRFLSAESNLVGDLDTEKDLTLEKGDQQIARVKEQAFMENILAARQERDAQLQAAEDAKAAQRHEEFLSKNQQLADEIGKQKIDPHRLFRDKGAGEQFLFVLGGALGGMLQGLQGGQNDFLARAERMVDRDIAAQEKDIDNKKASLSARQSLFGQMLQQHGDRRMAAMQTKNMMYESAKMHMRAKEMEATTPEMATNAKLAANAFQIKQDELTTQIAARSLQQQQAAAAAAAASARAAEEKQWQRGMDLAKLALEQDKAKIEIAKLEAAGRKDEAEQLRALSKELADPKSVADKVAVENAYNRLKGPDGTIDANKGLPGVGAMADAREKFAGKPQGFAAGIPAAHVANKLFGLNEQERVSRQDWMQLRQSYKHMITGSGGSDKEAAEIGAAFEGAKTPQEQANAVQKLYDTVNRLEQTKRAGFDPAVVRQFDAKLAGSGGAGMPASVRIKK